MRARDARWHFGWALLALLFASPAAAQDDGGVPADGSLGCSGGWSTAVDGSEVPAKGAVRLVRRMPGGDVVVDADVTTTMAYDTLGGATYTHTLAPRAPLTVGVTHVFQWTGACIGDNERPFGILPAVSLPAPPATLTATLIQTVRDYRRDELFVRVDLDLASDVLPWASALSFEVVVDETDRATLFLPYASTTRLRRDLFVRCAGRREDRMPRIDEGPHDLRAAVGGFGLDPALEVTTSTTVDCAHPLYLHAISGIPLTEEEIAALGPDGPPPGGDGGSGGLENDAAITAGDASVPSDAAITARDGSLPSDPPAGGRCSADASGRGSPGTWSMLVLALVVLAKRRATSVGRRG
jgi:hypothetical protein